MALTDYPSQAYVFIPIRICRQNHQWRIQAKKYVDLWKLRNNLFKKSELLEKYMVSITMTATPN